MSYRGGGEKWLTELANELVKRGHEVKIRCLPFWKRDDTENNLVSEIDYKEGYTHRLDGDVVYITYHPLNWLNFKTKSPKIGGIHSHCYWQPLERAYGFLPNLANFVNVFTSRFELRKFDAIHTVTNAYPINHPDVRFIPNFTDSNIYSPRIPKSDEFTVGYASRKVWQKGYDIFLKLEEILKDIKFVATDNIPEEKMPDFYSSKHLTLVPARVEMFGLSMLESMMCETPALVSSLPTYRGLDLPLKYAHTLDDYIRQIKSIRDIYEEEVYRQLAKDCRHSALKYDKVSVIDKLERMFVEVSKCET